MNKGGFSWKRLTGISNAKSKISRTIGVPLTKSGRQQKIGRIASGGGCLLTLITILVFGLLIFLTAIAAFGQHPPRALAEQLLIDDSVASDVARNSGYSIVEVIKQLNVRAVDIDGDGRLEFILSGLICGQNCSHWIYRQRGKSFERIPFEGSFTELKVLATSTKGHKDLLGRVFLNCCEGGLQTYQFNGTEYKPTICKIEKYGYTDSKGTYRRYKYPRVSDCE